MKSRRLFLAAALAVLMTGCVRVDVGDNLPTVGEELVDLQQAHALGAVSEEEFRNLRRAILARL